MELSEVTEEVFIARNPVQDQQGQVYMNFWKFGREEQCCESLHRLHWKRLYVPELWQPPGLWVIRNSIAEHASISFFQARC